MLRRQSSYAVAITGGSGCLGQHLVKLLQTKADHVSEIRVVDKLKYENKLGHEETKPVTSVCGDITNMDDLRRTFRGVKTVFHLCSLVSVSNFPDKEGMENVNVRGTEHVIEACIQEGVEHLLYCSTVETVTGFHDIVDGNEETTSSTGKLIDSYYGGSKRTAENFVLAENGRLLEKGGILKTAVLRPPAIYGELDRNYIFRVMRLAKHSRGILYRFGRKNTMFQQSYAGNIAWAFICGDKAIGSEREAAGEAYFITDDTPINTFGELVKPFLNLHGYKVSRSIFPFWLVYFVVKLIEIFLWIISPVLKVDLGYSSKGVSFVNRSVYFSSQKARTAFKYSPLFSPETSIAMAKAYYATLQI